MCVYNIKNDILHAYPLYGKWEERGESFFKLKMSGKSQALLLYWDKLPKE